MQKEPLHARATIRRFWQYTKPYPAYFWVASIGAALAVIVSNIVPPFIVARTFARLQTLYATHQAIQFKDFRVPFIAYAISMLISVALWRLQAYLAWKLEENVRRDMANHVYTHLQAQSQRFHADRFAGALVSQTTKFLGAYERLMDDLLWNVIPIVTSVVFAIGVLFFFSRPYGFVLLGVSTLYIFTVWRRIIKQLPHNYTQAKRESEETAALADSLANLGTIRSFAHEDYETKRFAKTTKRTLDATQELAVAVLKTDATSHIQTNGFQVIALFSGLLAVSTFHLNVSLLYLMLSYTQTITNQLWQFSRVVRNVNRGLGDAVEMVNMLAVEPEIQDIAEPEESHIHTGAVDFKNVTFFYPENEKNALFKGLNLHIKPGEKIGLVGPSGGGKTTITKLLLRFMDVQNGSISIDGQDIAKLRQREVRREIAYVAQEPILFHRSLADNIRYGDLGASLEIVQGVAKMANAHEFIAKLPEGYETFVGERGVKLSGGQRQRVAIARAMLKNAPILVLDEATSALDSESEVLIQEALWKLMEGRTAIVIAHRLSTIQKMDRIVVLDEGQIVEQGTHKELIARKNGTYAKLWAHQSGGFMED